MLKKIAGEEFLVLEISLREKFIIPCKYIYPWERAHQYDSNDTPQPICECQVDFPLLWIKAYPGLS